jgi:hypothetical protein
LKLDGALHFHKLLNELGWADFRVTRYSELERWWELVRSAYLMVSLQAEVFQGRSPPRGPRSKRTEATEQLVRRHRWWDPGRGGKNALHNLRLLIQPYCSCCLISPWLEVFRIPWLITCLNHFPGHIPI